MPADSGWSDSRESRRQRVGATHWSAVTNVEDFIAALPDMHRTRNVLVFLEAAKDRWAGS